MTIEVKDRSIYIKVGRKLYDELWVILVDNTPDDHKGDELVRNLIPVKKMIENTGEILNKRFAEFHIPQDRVDAVISELDWYVYLYLEQPDPPDFRSGERYMGKQLKRLKNNLKEI